MRLQFRGCPFLTHQGMKMREQLRNVMHYLKNYKNKLYPSFGSLKLTKYRMFSESESFNML